jgi:hypothetical protein
MSVIHQLKRPGGEFFVTANDYRGYPVFPAFPQTTFIKNIQGDKVFLTNDALSGDKAGVSGPHTIYFHDNSLKNRQREIDALEVSQFGGLATPNNAQFALQPTQASEGGDPRNVHGFQLNDNGALTTEMVWKGPKTPVEFKVFYGNYDGIQQLKGVTPAFEYTSKDGPVFQNAYVPNSEDQTFHINLWQFNYNGQQPAPSATEVIITKFQYEPIT